MHCSTPRDEKVKKTSYGNYEIYTVMVPFFVLYSLGFKEYADTAFERGQNRSTLSPSMALPKSESLTLAGFHLRFSQCFVV